MHFKIEKKNYPVTLVKRAVGKEKNPEIKMRFTLDNKRFITGTVCSFVFSLLVQTYTPFLTPSSIVKIWRRNFVCGNFKL